MGKKRKIPLRCLKDLEGMGFIAGSGLGLHALKYSSVSFVLLVKPLQPSERLICFVAFFFLLVTVPIYITPCGRKQFI